MKRSAANEGLARRREATAQGIGRNAPSSFIFKWMNDDGVMLRPILTCAHVQKKAGKEFGFTQQLPGILWLVSPRLRDISKIHSKRDKNCRELVRTSTPRVLSSDVIACAGFHPFLTGWKRWAVTGR